VKFHFSYPLILLVLYELRPFLLFPPWKQGQGVFAKLASAQELKRRNNANTAIINTNFFFVNLISPDILES
jgi:hypothetical protein